MAKAKRLLIGLGNPGAEYTDTRHNVGFMVIDALAEKTHPSKSKENKGLLSQIRSMMSGTGRYALHWHRFKGREFGLAKPLTYMNRSGSAVAGLLKRFGLTPRDMLILVDDIHLPVGTLRLRQRGGAGNHNGLQDIIDTLHTQDFPRLRIGVGNDFETGTQADYVLSPFAEAEQPVMETAILAARDAALTFVTEGIVPAMNRHNRK